ncbi:cobalamin B12-binding domain-containing protein [Streptomyces meridianus]|uniref:Cobalamin-dependent protein n=1 Tax=Streptomyces meridianus TaxID=2938945 RepID=A0ABT0X3H7_9ACTN|nr:B12-binding domain-containing protein [Streptomyces meridianus]MCM2576770.1 cobalamin-dependent protein [Streptomyces meridianus]
MTDTSVSRSAPWSDRLWSSVLDGDERAAVDSVLDALDAGLEPQSVLLDVIAATQRRVGEEWAADRLTVAQEHAATAINERAVAALSAHPACRPGPGSRGRITVACVDGEWHALPARLLAEVLRLDGWRVDFLGAQVPSAHLVTHLHRTGPDAVALSGSLPTRLPTAHAAVIACQSASVPVLAGGAAFGTDGRYAKRLRADAWAPDARAAVNLLAAALPKPGPAHQAVDALPHLSDHEYTMIASARSKLVQDTMAGMADRFPPMREYTELQRRHTAEDIAHIVDHLACALYVDDDRLFTDFLAWTAGILTSRRVPAHSLVLALETIGLQLHDFPRACGFVRTARESVARTVSSPSS